MIFFDGALEECTRVGTMSLPLNAADTSPHLTHRYGMRGAMYESILSYQYSRSGAHLGAGLTELKAVLSGYDGSLEYTA